MAIGFFQVDRDIWSNPAFKDEVFSEREAFLWMQSDAAWSQRERNVHGRIVGLLRGQLVAASRFLGERWGWSEASVRRYLKRLERAGLVELETDAGVTVVTICNYDRFSKLDGRPDAPVTHVRRKQDANEKKRKKEEEKKKKEANSVETGHGLTVSNLKSASPRATCKTVPLGKDGPPIAGKMPGNEMNAEKAQQILKEFGFSHGTKNFVGPR